MSRDHPPAPGFIKEGLMTMTDPGYRHYLLIVDRSGSMIRILGEAQNGIRYFICEQAALPGKASMSLVQFDNEPELVYDFESPETAAFYKLVPRNMTALLDACGFAITREGEKLAAMPEEARPGKVIVLVTTDGKENASREWTRQQIRDLITRQRQDYGWQFSYVGANVDAFAEAGAIGIPQGATMNYAGTGEGTKSAYRGASAAAARYACGQSVNVSYTEEERKRAAGG